MKLLELFLQIVLFFFNPIILIPVLIIIIFLIKKIKEYRDTAYYQITRLSYFAVFFNKGRYGEYLIYKNLEHMEENGAKFLFNLYIPRGNGKTTEIDVLMICSKGIFVFESKNYGGWIFGSENQTNWCQTFPKYDGTSRKVYFYNPIKQNNLHIKCLKEFIDRQIPMWSIIVFSERCTLKKIEINSKDICVVNRDNVSAVVFSIYNQNSMDVLNKNNISEIYKKLYPFTQVDKAVKAQHIKDISASNDTLLEDKKA